MKKAIEVNSHHYLVEYPDKCPICHHFGDIKVVRTKITSSPNVEVVFECPFPECRKYFIGRYKKFGQPELLQLIPSVPELKSFPPLVDTLSPNFIAIYRQAEEAKHLGLDQIAGPGFRKAFEFLIKDYALSKSDESEREKIETAFSGKIIESYIQDRRIQAVAQRALWLGNDETHYLRKWETKDIGDLINLIKLTIDWIDIEITSETYIAEMPKGV